MTVNCRICRATLNEKKPGVMYWAQGKWGGFFDSKIYASTVEYYCGTGRNGRRSCFAISDRWDKDKTNWFWGNTPIPKSAYVKERSKPLPVAEKVKNAIDKRGKNSSSKQSKQRFIYFVQSESGAIKIGIANDVQKRFSSLKTASSEELELIAFFEGTAKDEKALHKRFFKYHIRGEWFESAQEILDFIDSWEQGRESA